MPKMRCCVTSLLGLACRVAHLCHFLRGSQARSRCSPSKRGRACRRSLFLLAIDGGLACHFVCGFRFSCRVVWSGLVCADAGFGLFQGISGAFAGLEARSNVYRSALPVRLCLYADARDGARAGGGRFVPEGQSGALFALAVVDSCFCRDLRASSDVRSFGLWAFVVALPLRCFSLAFTVDVLAAQLDFEKQTKKAQALTEKIQEKYVHSELKVVSLFVSHHFVPVRARSGRSAIGRSRFAFCVIVAMSDCAPGVAWLFLS
jgi:hypothetical protein